MSDSDHLREKVSQLEELFEHLSARPVEGAAPPPRIALSAPQADVGTLQDFDGQQYVNAPFAGGSAADVQIALKLPVGKNAIWRPAANRWELLREIHVAVPPCGVGIPARVGTKPGHAECCLYRLVPIQPGDADYSAATAPDCRLAPVPRSAQIATTTPTTAGPSTTTTSTTTTPEPCLRQTVYNFTLNAIPPRQPPNEIYWPVYQDAYGQWFVDPTPDEVTTTTIAPWQFVADPCARGNCKFTWDGSKWNLAANNCATTTTSTTTTTPAGSTTSTTTTTCLCPTSSTTSTTTTTCCPPPVACYCTYPSHCGSNVGECFYSGCSGQPGAGDTTHNKACTTTTCVCPTTTTLAGGTTTTCNPSNCGTSTTGCPCTSTTSSTTSTSTTTCNCGTTSTLPPGATCANCPPGCCCYTAPPPAGCLTTAPPGVSMVVCYQCASGGGGSTCCGGLWPSGCCQGGCASPCTPLCGAPQANGVCVDGCPGALMKLTCNCDGVTWLRQPYSCLNSFGPYTQGWGCVTPEEYYQPLGGLGAAPVCPACLFDPPPSPCTPGDVKFISCYAGYPLATTTTTPSTGTTPAPACGNGNCPNCYTTTSTSTTSTTTTTPSCSGECKYQWAAWGAWVLITNGCAGTSCVCTAPQSKGHESCEVTWTPCGTTTTTTTTSSTTSTTTTTGPTTTTSSTTSTTTTTGPSTTSSTTTSTTTTQWYWCCAVNTNCANPPNQCQQGSQFAAPCAVATCSGPYTSQFLCLQSCGGTTTTAAPTTTSSSTTSSTSSSF